MLLWLNVFLIKNEYINYIIVNIKKRLYEAKVYLNALPTKILNVGFLPEEPYTPTAVKRPAYLALFTALLRSLLLGQLHQAESYT
jgi:hypothetical protein